MLNNSRKELKKNCRHFQTSGSKICWSLSYCSGELARKTFAEKYREYFINVGVGKVISGEELQ